MTMRRFRDVFPFVLGLTAFISGFCNEALADATTKAVRMHQRLTGVPPTNPVRDQMAALIQNGQPADAARIAIESPNFYRLTLKNWAKPLTNEDELVLVPLNDMVATMVGMIRDDKPFDQVLYGNILYTAADGTANVRAYATNNNDHFLDLENADLRAVLRERVQSDLNGVTDTAGVLTSRAYGAAFMDAGTNRAVVRWAFKNFLCLDMEQLSDITVPDYRVRRDVDRAPGGDSRTFKTQCVGCHAGMDALAGATAYFNFVNGEVTETPGTVAAKINAQVKFPNTAVANDSWVNLWGTGQNARLGWAALPPGTSVASGNGLRSFGQLLARTEEFNRCMAKRVFKQVCQRDPVLDATKSNSEVTLIQALANQFKNANYSMKALFAATASQCMGE